LPQLGKHLSCVHLSSAGKQYLLDCGDGSIYQLLSYDIKEDDLDAVIITHLHPDHVAGIFMLVQMLYLEGRSREFKIFVPERSAEIAELFPMFYTFPSRIGFKLSVMDISELSSHLPGWEAMENDHLLGYRDVISKHDYPNPMRAYSLRITAGNKAFVYSSDLGTTDSILPLLKGVDTLLVDAGHPSEQQIIQLKDQGVKRILLTHGVPQTLLRKLLKEDDGIFEEAIEGVIYNI